MSQRYKKSNYFRATNFELGKDSEPLSTTNNHDYLKYDIKIEIKPKIEKGVHNMSLGNHKGDYSTSQNTLMHQDQNKYIFQNHPTKRDTVKTNFKLGNNQDVWESTCNSTIGINLPDASHSTQIKHVVSTESHFNLCSNKNSNYYQTSYTQQNIPIQTNNLSQIKNKKSINSSQITNQNLGSDNMNQITTNSNNQYEKKAEDMHAATNLIKNEIKGSHFDLKNKKLKEDKWGSEANSSFSQHQEQYSNQKIDTSGLGLSSVVLGQDRIPFETESSQFQHKPKSDLRGAGLTSTLNRETPNMTNIQFPPGKGTYQSNQSTAFASPKTESNLESKQSKSNMTNKQNSMASNFRLGNSKGLQTETESNVHYKQTNNPNRILSRNETNKMKQSSFKVSEQKESYFKSTAMDEYSKKHVDVQQAKDLNSQVSWKVGEDRDPWTTEHKSIFTPQPYTKTQGFELHDRKVVTHFSLGKFPTHYKSTNLEQMNWKQPEVDKFFD